MTIRSSTFVALLLGGCSAAPPTPPPPPSLELQPSGTDVRVQAVSVVDARVAWASGLEGTFLRTTDGGRTWQRGAVPGADTLQLRDIHALDARTAWVLSAGTGDQSRIYRTDDGGATWTLQWTNPEAEGFYDCFDFWDARRAVAYGDAVGGALRVLVTDDGGARWRLVAADALPPALPGEGGFAASGTCVQAGAGGTAWIATGNAAPARVLRTEDYGASWSAAAVPVVAGDGAGLTSISMADARRGTAFGGNLSVTDQRTENVARTEDGGRTWSALPHVAMNGALYGGVHVPGTDGRVILAVGPGGADLSTDGGRTWRSLDGRAWWGIGSAGPGATWIAGPDGRIARVLGLEAAGGS